MCRFRSKFWNNSFIIYIEIVTRELREEETFATAADEEVD